MTDPFGRLPRACLTFVWWCRCRFPVPLLLLTLTLVADQSSANGDISALGIDYRAAAPVSAPCRPSIVPVSINERLLRRRRRLRNSNSGPRCTVLFYDRSVDAMSMLLPALAHWRVCLFGGLRLPNSGTIGFISGYRLTGSVGLRDQRTQRLGSSEVPVRCASRTGLESDGRTGEEKA